MFAKIINGIIEKYPYNYQEDYPFLGMDDDALNDFFIDAATL